MSWDIDQRARADNRAGSDDSLVGIGVTGAEAVVVGAGRKGS